MDDEVCCKGCDEGPGGDEGLASLRPSVTTPITGETTEEMRLRQRDVERSHAAPVVSIERW